MRFLFLILLFSPPAFAVGGVVNKGGDSVYCGSSIMGSAGYYMLDYALAIGRGANPREFAKPTSWRESSEWLSSILSKFDPDMAYSFGKFALSVRQKDQSFERGSVLDWVRKWISHKGKPLEVDDVGDISQLPVVCKYRYKPGLHPKFSIYRLVERSAYEPRRLITYRYDKRKLLHVRHPVQYSFLMVHEWLWDFTEDIEVNRRVNAFLHSRRIETMSGTDIAAELKALGL